MNGDWGIESDSDAEDTNYWASYSDLMAGILLVFALAAAASWVELRQSLVKPTETLNAWQEYLNSLCASTELAVLRAEGAVDIDCEIGRLVISESSLRYPLNGVQLSEEGERLLERVVPPYLAIVRNSLASHPSVELEGVEISGHTDSTGDLRTNSYIGRDRAGRVYVFLMESPVFEPFRDLLDERGYTSGFRDSRPPEGVARGGETELARRIEIQVRIKNVSVLRDLRRLLNQLTRAR